MALTQHDLNQMRCARVGCTHEGHGLLYVHGECHPEAPAWAGYDAATGTLEVSCAECEAPITTIAVATGEARRH